jgi:hypothetical protein
MIGGCIVVALFASPLSPASWFADAYIYTSAERDLYATEVQANTEIKKLTEHTKAVWLETCELLYQAARRDRRRNNQRDYADDIQQSHKHDCDTLGYP